VHGEGGDAGVLEELRGAEGAHAPAAEAEKGFPAESFFGERERLSLEGHVERVREATEAPLLVDAHGEQDDLFVRRF
jgi:hypothetical protein